MTLIGTVCFLTYDLFLFIPFGTLSPDHQLPSLSIFSYPLCLLPVHLEKDELEGDKKSEL